MHQWIWPAYVGIFGGVGLFALILIPILIVQFRKYGSFSFPRFLGAAAISVYVIALIAYTLLPLPNPDTLDCSAGAHILQSTPGASLNDIAQVISEHGRRAALTSPTVLQVVFNVALFVPLGVFLRRFAERSFLFTVFMGALTSLAIEATQYTGLRGIYDCAYRVADIDDLITNTLGTIIGALCAPLLLAFMPRKQELEPKRLVAKPVTKKRRALGMAIDYFLYTVVVVVLIGINATAGRLYYGTQWVPDRGVELAITLLTALIVVVMPALIGSGASWGQRAVWLAPDFPNKRRIRALARMLFGFGGYVLLDTIGTYASGTVADLTAGASTLFMILTVATLLFRKSAQGISYRVAGAGIVDSRS